MVDCFCFAGHLPEGLLRELPDAEVFDEAAQTEEAFVKPEGDLDDLQKQLEALNAFWPLLLVTCTHKHKVFIEWLL